MPTLANPSPTADALVAIDVAAKAYSQSRETVAERVATYNKEIAAVNRRLLPGIKSASVNAKFFQANLTEQVQAHADLFVKPRTMTLHGIKLGFQKGKGTIEWADDEKLADKIEKLLPELAETLVKTTRKPIAKALQTLDVKTLRALGCTVEETGDFVVVRAVDTAVDKLVARILAEGAIEEAE